MLAFLMPLFASLKAFLVANALSLAVKASPPLLFAGLFLAEWYGDTTFGKVRLVGLLVSALTLYLDAKGSLPFAPVAGKKGN